MKISIITPIYKNAQGLRKFLTHLSQQVNKSFELVLVVDTNTEKTLSVIDEFRGLKAKMKLVFNSKRQGRTRAIKDGIKVATGDYSIIVSPSNSIKTTFINDAVAIAKLRKTDVIEFKASFKHPKKFNGNIRKTFNKPVLISEHPEIIAMSYPFDYNKLWRTELLKEVVSEPVLLEVNSRFSVALVYKALLRAKTYSTASKILVNSKVELSTDFNPLKLMRQWKELTAYVEERYDGKYNAEMLYARYFHEIVFLFAFVGISKNKVLLAKVKKNFDASLKTDFKDFFHTNKYALLKTKETKIIVENRTASKLTKLFKEL